MSGSGSFGVYIHFEREFWKWVTEKLHSLDDARRIAAWMAANRKSAKLKKRNLLAKDLMTFRPSDASEIAE